MSVNWQQGTNLKTKLGQIEQTVEILRKLRDGEIAFSDSVLRVIDDAIVESEEQLALLRNAIVN
jgi:hypothetical protein